MDDEPSAADRPEVLIVFREPVVRPGTPEAQAQGCLCRFETNMAAAFLAAERGDLNEGRTIVVIHEDCPLHQIIRDPTDDVLGTE
jgi:predicted methyltransferase